MGIDSAPLAKNNIPGSSDDYDNQITQYRVEDEFLSGLNNINPMDARPGRDVEVSARYAPEQEPGITVRLLKRETRCCRSPIINWVNTAPEIGDSVKIYG